MSADNPRAGIIRDLSHSSNILIDDANDVAKFYNFYELEEDGMLIIHIPLKKCDANAYSLHLIKMQIIM